MSHTRARRRAPLRTLVAAGAAVGLTLSAAPAQALTAADVESGATAGSRTADWLVAQLGEDDLVHGEYEFPEGTWNEYTDHGLSLDLVYAFRRLGGHAAEQKAIIDAMEAEQGAYTNNGAYAGPLGKLTQVVVSAGRDVNAYGDGQLDDQLRARVVTAPGSEKGRAKDLVDPTDEFSADYSNTIGQAFVVRAFAELEELGRVRETTRFLLQQQCAAGFFREGMDGTDNSCDASKGAPSVDSTAHGIRALLAARAAGVANLGDDISDAVAWLVRTQRADGSWVGNGTPNANSTGLAAYALASTGRAGAAGNGAAWIRAHQVDGLTARQSPALAGEVGTIAYSDDDLATGRQSGISRAARRTWQRAAAEGALALPSLLPARSLTVAAPDRAARGAKVSVTVRGLRAGESWSLTRNGTVVARGKVPSTGRVTTSVRMPDARTTVRLGAVGSRLGRTGSKAVTVR